MKDANIDLVGKTGGQGAVANKFKSGGINAGRMRPYIYTDPKTGRDGMYVTTYKGGDVNDPKSYQMTPVNNATLRRDEWKQLDEAVLKISESRLTGIQDLINAGLTYQLGNAMGTTVLEWHDVSDAMEADLTMDGINRSQNDRPNFTTNYLPIPIIHSDYEINARVLEASRSLGNPLDTTSAERAARKVNEKLENMLFTSTSYAFGGGTIYSYVNFPDRNTQTLSENWDASGKTGQELVNEVIAMKQKALNKHFYGPYVLYIPSNYESVMDEDFNPDAAASMTKRERLMKINGITDVKLVDTLPDDNVLLVQMTPDVVRLVQGMGVQNVEWESEGGMVTNYKVMTIQVPQIRSDQEGKTGIVHLA